MGKVLGPWLLAYHLYGIEDLSMDMILQPDKLNYLFRKLTDCSIEFAKAQFESGADYVTWIDHVTSDFFNPLVYKEQFLPLHQLAARKLKSYGPIVFGAFGNISDRLDLIAQTGFPILNLITCNDYETAKKEIGGKMVILGDVNNPDVIVAGSMADIRHAVYNLIDRGCRILTPESVLPFNTPTANILELTQTVRKVRLK